MSVKTKEEIQRLFSQFVRDALSGLPPEERTRYQEEFQKRADELVQAGSDGAGPTAFLDLVGLGARGSVPFDEVSTPRLQPDFDDSVIQSQLHAAAELYYIYQHERMKVFQVVGVLMRMFHDGRMRVQRGPGARALYLVEKHHPLRYKPRDRMLAYRRAFNYGTIAPPSRAVVYRNFHRQFVAFNAAIAQYFRDLLIGEVIRGSQLIDQRPFGSQATIQRLGTDLRWGLDRATYGNLYSLTVETGNYLKVVLDMLETPDIKKAFDANTKWDVIEFVSERHLGGQAEISQRIKLADSGRRLLEHVSNDPFSTRDFNLFQAQIQPLGPVAEEWIAAYRMVPEGRAFPGITPALRAMLGASTVVRQAAATAG
jgi:hypothetical protein